MKKANQLVTAAFWALLATHAPQALSQETRQLAEPFRTDVTTVLNWEQWQLTRVESPDQLAESYVPWSSVVVEWDFALSDRILQDLQKEINENYSHLNILIYLAEDGRSFEEYNGQRLRSSDLCGTNPGLAYLRDSFYEWADQAGEWNHIIFYLAAKEPGYDYNMVCTLISPQMADIIGSDEEIFVSWRPLFDNVFRELKQDFNRLWAINVFLRGVDERVQQVTRQQEREQASHMASVNSIRTQLSWYTTWIEWVLSWSISLEGSAVYTEFTQRYAELEVLIQWEAEYIPVSSLERAQKDIRDLDDSYNSVFSAITWFQAASQRIAELRDYSTEFQSSEYYDTLNTQNAELVLSLTQAKELIDAWNLDYFTAMQVVEQKYENIQSAIERIKFTENAKKVWMWWAALGFLWTLWYLNRRKKRINSRKEFISEFTKLEAWLKKIQKVFNDEIEWNTESIEIFFWDQKWITWVKIQQLKISVAYISVLLPKIREILASVKSTLSIRSLSKFRSHPYENAIDMLMSDKHIIDPSKSDADRKLLSKISGEEIQDFSTLMDKMSKTLPELISLLDENINTTKEIFWDLNKANEDTESALSTNTKLTNKFSQELDDLVLYLGPNFSELKQWWEKCRSAIEDKVSDNSWEDLLGEYEEVIHLNAYIDHCRQILSKISELITSEQPAKYRWIFQEAWYDTTWFLHDIISRYKQLFSCFEWWVDVPENTDSIEKASNSIFTFYREMKALSGLHTWKVLQSERREWLLWQVVTSTSDILEHYWNQIKTDKLFSEDASDVHELLDSTQQLIQTLWELIQQREGDEWLLALSTLESDLDTGHDVIKQTNLVAQGYEKNRAKITEIEEGLVVKLPSIKSCISKLKSDFHSDVLTLRSDDYSAQGSDHDISNNWEEIEAFLSEISTKYDIVSSLLEEWKFLELQNTLEEIYVLLEHINEYILEVEHVDANVRSVYSNNPKKFALLEERLEVLNQKSKTYPLTVLSLDKVTKLNSRRELLVNQLSVETPNPYDIEDSILEFDDIVSKLEQEIERDKAEREEYNEYIKTAWETLQKLKRLIWEADSDNQPDSKKARKVIGSIDDINRAYIRLSWYLNTKNADWYELTDNLEEFIEICEGKINVLYQDEKDRWQAYSEIQDAWKKVKSAKKWSWRHVSISSSVWENYLRSAHSAFNNWDFDNAISYSRQAEQKAISEISDAENRDRAEIRKRAKEAAAAARRRRNSYSSSSSSNFWWGSSFGWGGWGFSGFSGGWGF